MFHNLYPRIPTVADAIFIPIKHIGTTVYRTWKDILALFIQVFLIHDETSPTAPAHFGQKGQAFLVA